MILFNIFFLSESMHSHGMIIILISSVFIFHLFCLYIPVILHHNLTWLAALYIVVYSFIVCMCNRLILSKWMNAFQLSVVCARLPLAVIMLCLMQLNSKQGHPYPSILFPHPFPVISLHPYQFTQLIALILHRSHLISHSSPHFSSIPLINFSSIPSHWLLIPFLFPPLKAR